MLQTYKCFFSVLFGLIAFMSIAQDTSLTKELDHKYREDQFYLGVSYNVVTSVPSGVNQRGFSGGFQFGFLRDMPINQRRNVAIAIGLGFAFDQYNQDLFIGETTSGESIFEVIPSSVDYKTNRFNTSVIEVPIEIRWRTSTVEKNKFWRVYAGLKVGYTYWYKATFKQTNNNVNQTDIPEYDRIRFTGSLSSGWNTVSLYVNYTINPFFKDAQTTDGQEVNFRTVKLGMIFYIL